MELTSFGTVAPYPKGKNNCNSFLIAEENTKLMLDCGFGSTSLLDMYKDLRDLTVFISHYHPDHYGDLFALFNGSYIAHKLGYLQNRVEVYLPPKEFSYNKEIPDAHLLFDSSHPNFLSLSSYNKEQTIEIAPFQITFYKTKHGGNSYAMKIIGRDKETLVYSGDTAYDEGLAKFAYEADAFICEATYLRGQNRGADQHLYAYEAGKLAHHANVQDLYLFHTFPELDKDLYVEEAKEYFLNTHKLEEGQTLQIRKR